MEKNYKLPFRPSCEATTTARTNFNTPLHSTLSSSRDNFHAPGPLSRRFLHCRSGSSINLAQNNCLKVKPEPLRSNEDKHLRHSQFVDPNSHKQKSPRPNYFEQGKIVHRDVDWILYNICNCMVTLWVKNQRTLRGIQQFLASSKQKNLNQKSHSSQQQTILKAPTVLENTQRIQKGRSTYESAKINRDMFNFKFSNTLDTDPIKEEQQVKQIIQLIFSSKKKKPFQNQPNSNCSQSLKKHKQQKPHNSINYKFLLEQNDPRSALNQITAKSQKLYPILMDFSRTILIKKENLLLQKLLKNQKLDDFILESLNFDDKVKMYQSILDKRMDDFKLLKQSFIKFTAGAEQHLQQTKKLINKFISKGQIKCSNTNNVFMKSISFDEVLSLFNGQISQNFKTINHECSSLLKMKQTDKKDSNRFADRGPKSKYNQRQLQFGFSSVNIQIGENFKSDQQIQLKPKDQTRKPTNKKQRLSIPNCDQVLQANQETGKKEKRPFLKSLRSLRHTHDNQIGSASKIPSLFQPKNLFEHQKPFELSAAKKNTLKHKNSLANPLKNQETTHEQKHQIKDQEEKQIQKPPKMHDLTNFKFIDKSSSKQSKKKLELNDSPKRNLFLKNKRKGIKFNPLTTKQFLKFLHDRNISKLAEPVSQLLNDQNDIYQKKQKQKFFTADNSPAKNKMEVLSPTQKNIKTGGNYYGKRQKKTSQRNIRRSLEKQRTLKVQQKQAAVMLSSDRGNEFKAVSKLRRLKFEGQSLMRHKIIEIILRQKMQMDQQQNSYMVRDKMIGYFHQLLESGMFDNEGMAEHKENVQNLICNYDTRRRNANVKKSVELGENKQNENLSEFNINVKLRYDDPQIFERLRQIHEGLKQNPASSIFQTPVFSEDLLNQELNEFKRNQKYGKRSSNAEFDLDFYDFFSPIRTRYLEDEGQAQLAVRNSNQEEHEMIQFMKRLLQKNSLFLGQKDI